MRLKRLEMVGFKSFADKTRVEFEPGITAVVGPNGCGKSNISDSIRWALGEMSAKSLRSGQMLDVIFNGTANRPALGMSEVSLTFDNTSRKIPLDYSEVTISRRLFRSGESEYFINKTQCRLRDLKELFLDTGVGNDGYYVMAQGKIEFILSSKPEERRELFEEAAGVSKYKARREEAIRRLNRVEQDMLRLNDSLAIYKQQMESLEVAVRKAKQHQEVKEKLRSLEIASSVIGFQKAQDEFQRLYAQQEERTQRLQSLRDEVTQRETALSEARGGSEGTEQQVIELQKQVAQCESEWARTEAERRAAQERETELKSAQERLAIELQTVQQGLAEAAELQTRLVTEIEEIRAQYQERNQRFKEEDEKGRVDQQAMQEQQRALDSSKARVLELVRLISHHRNETVRLTSLSIRHEEASKAKQRELEKVQMRRAALDEQLTQQQAQLTETQSRLKAVQEQLQSLDEQQAKDEAALAETLRTIQSGRERMARLEAERVSLERWLSQDPVAMASSALQQHPIPGVYGPISSLMKTGPAYQRLLDRALGDRASWWVAETFNDAQEAVRFLSEGRHGWATFIILDRIPEAEAFVPTADDSGTRSLAVQVDCDEKFRRLQQHLLGKTYYLGATLFEEAMLKGGADPEKEAFQATPTELNRLTDEIQQLRTTLDQATQLQDQLKQAISTRRQERGPLQSEQNKVQITAQVQEQGIKRLRDDQQMAETEEKILQNERDESLRAIQQAQQALAQEEVLLTTLEEEETTLQQSVQAQDAALAEVRQKIQAHQAVVSQLRLDAETTRERLNGKEREGENARRQHGSLEQRQRQMEAEQTHNTERLAQLASSQVEKASRLETLQGTREQQQSQLSTLLNERQTIQERLQGQEQELSKVREALLAAQSQAQEAEFQTRTLDQDRQRFEQSLRDTYQLSIDEARGQMGDVQPNPEELARLRRRLENLGNVNLAAPEEHAEIEQRYQFLQTQQQDLLKAKDDLHQAITKINATTREHFKATFDQVRQNFKMLYQTLFQGGESDLVLTNEQDLMETGIEILAQPPGKKTQNLSLLSGGEKALTAIALLFAFFMVKPSPFCLLDEVDAPLDEANVGRFLRMVKSFSEKTQFIVITHNKRSMEMADVLYGVTMPQLGVSSLMSVKMEERKPAETVAA